MMYIILAVSLLTWFSGQFTGGLPYPTIASREDYSRASSSSNNVIANLQCPPRTYSDLLRGCNYTNATNTAGCSAYGNDAVITCLNCEIHSFLYYTLLSFPSLYLTPHL